ncbi:acyl-CoA thioesterase [Nocardia bovistercoris]|uniref:Thioesterase family protein n=1 Tax=Nocardia bovistercoris TaxID=2785916 RepID=A0A931I9V4_9NOCA|nr:acyl-CoA thioesterase domain-containing protein [Nocardia bovistercoris]MBH0776563.1 thioesterase family protein [Nocardia bovistercoris]
MSDMWSDLLACLDLREITDEGDNRPEDTLVYEGLNQKLEYHRIFGGQILGQLLVAARLACPDKAIKSLHTVFPKEGRSDQPVRYEVVRRHEGRSFATLAITATQGANTVAAAVASTHAPEAGEDRQSVEKIADSPAQATAREFGLLPWEVRAEADLDSYDAGPPEYSFWMRTPEVAENLAPSVAAYATDLTLIGTALRPLAGVSHVDNGKAFLSAVTSHTLWFHRPIRTDHWLLMRQHSPILAHGRAFGRGDMLTEEGELVASFAQEALVRFPS